MLVSPAFVEREVSSLGCYCNSMRKCRSYDDVKFLPKEWEAATGQLAFSESRGQSLLKRRGSVPDLMPLGKEGRLTGLSSPAESRCAASRPFQMTGLPFCTLYPHSTHKATAPCDLTGSWHPQIIDQANPSPEHRSVLAARTAPLQRSISDGQTAISLLLGFSEAGFPDSKAQPSSCNRDGEVRPSWDAASKQQRLELIDERFAISGGPDGSAAAHPVAPEGVQQQTQLGIGTVPNASSQQQAVIIAAVAPPVAAAAEHSPQHPPPPPPPETLHSFSDSSPALLAPPAIDQARVNAAASAVATTSSPRHAADIAGDAPAPSSGNWAMAHRSSLYSRVQDHPSAITPIPPLLDHAAPPTDSSGGTTPTSLSRTSTGGSLAVQETRRSLDSIMLSSHMNEGHAAEELFFRLNHARQTFDFVKRQVRGVGDGWVGHVWL
jgi:hypothetical protein